MSIAYSQQHNPNANVPAPRNPAGMPPVPNNPSRSGPPPPSPAQIQKILDENCGLIQTIQDFQNMGKAMECKKNFFFL